MVMHQASVRPARQRGSQNAVRTILHVIETDGPGGAETVMLRLIQRLDPEKWRAVAVVSGDGWLKSSLVDADIDVRTVGSSGSFDWRWLRRVHALAAEANADLIQTHLFGAAVYGSVVGALRGVPVVSTIHGEVDVRTHDRALWVKARLLRAAGTQLVAVSRSVQAGLARNLAVARDQVRVIPNGVDTATDEVVRQATRRALGLGDDHYVVGAIGNIRGPKDYHTLLEAAAILLDHHPHVRFLIVGDTEGEQQLYHELLSHRARLGLDDRVEFLGFRSDISTILGSLDGYVMSSDREGLPLALLQAMAAGCPVVATRCGGPQEVVMDGENGLLVPVGQPQQLAASLGRLITDPNLAQRIGRAAQVTVEESYSLDATVRAYEQLYDEVLAGKRTLPATRKLGHDNQLDESFRSMKQ